MNELVIGSSSALFARMHLQSTAKELAPNQCSIVRRNFANSARNFTSRMQKLSTFGGGDDGDKLGMTYISDEREIADCRLLKTFNNCTL
jgi:hypothetical protein